MKARSRSRSRHKAKLKRGTITGGALIGFSTTLGKFDILQKFLKEAGFTVRLVSKIESVETHPVLFEIFEAVPFKS